jgi:tetratricopeptide (TPR) repeat protein
MRLVLGLLVGMVVGAGLGSGVAHAQSAAAPAVPTAAMQQVWQAAGTLHETKLQFIAAIQRVTQAQAGLFGDERPQLEAAVTAMRRALEAWDEGIVRFVTATNGLTMSADLHVARGTVLLDRHRMADALRELNEAAGMAPDRADVPALQALALGAQGRPAEALQALARAAAKAPDNPVLVYGQAQRALESHQPADAQRYLARVAQLLAPRMHDAAAAPQAPFERVGLIRQVPGLAPIFPLARYAAAYAALASNDFPGAVAAFEQAMQGDPLGRSGEPARGAVLGAAGALRRGQTGEARRLAESAISAAPDEAEAQRVLARALWVDGANEQALEHAATAVRLSMGDERTRLLHAELLASAGQSAAMRQALEDVVRAEPKSGTAHYRLALLHQADGRLAEARAALDQCARLNAVVGQDHIYFLQGSIAANQADIDATIEAYTRRVDVNPNSTEAHRQIGEVYFLQGRDDEALAEHSVAVLLAPRNGRAHGGRGQVLLRQQHYADAVAAFRQAVSAGDDRLETRYGLGVALTRDGHAEEGRVEIDASQELRAKAIAQGQLEFEQAALRRAAVAEQEAGRHDEAVALFERVLALDPASGRSQQDLGSALLAAGRPGPAARQLRVALDSDPTVETAAALATALAAVGDEAGRMAVMARHAQLVEERRRDRVRALTGAP